MKKVVIISDCTDVAYNEMCQSIINHYIALGNNEESIKIDPLIKVEPFSIINANFLSRLATEIYPKGTIFLIVVNPCKDRPKRIFAISKNDQLFVTANTGSITWINKDHGIKKLYETKDPGFIPFGGKYVHSKIVAELANGSNYNSMGKPIRKNLLKKIKIKKGTIIHIDNFGLIKIFDKIKNTKENMKYKVYINSKKFVIATFSKRMMNQPTNTWTIYPGSSLNSLLEIGKVRNINGAKELNAKIGDIVTWRKLNE
jgi:S-adenosylmethionine hydrolase